MLRVLVLLVVASSAFADPPVTVVKVPPTEPARWTEISGKAGYPVKLSAGEKPVQWTLVDDVGSELVVASTDPKTPTVGLTATFGAPKAARYRILLHTGVVGEAAARVAITLDGVIPDPPTPPFPPPPVPPDPPIPPPPQPTGKVAKFVILEDTKKAGAWRGDLLGSPAFATLLNADGLRYRILDINAQEGADAEAQAFFVKAVGKELPYYWTFDAAKTQLFEGKAPMTVADFMVLVTGQPQHKRAMGNNPPNAKKYAWKQFGAEPRVPLIPRGEWKAIDLSAFLPPVHDQNGKGQCNASATCTAIEAARKMSGLPYVYLSAGDLYSQINDGRDQGSTLEDGLYAAMNTGVCTAATVPYVWDGRNHSNDAKVKGERQLYMVLEAYECPNFDAMASALQQGFFIIEGLMWADGDNADRDGWIPARPSGGQGGHALCGYGLVQRNGVWGIRTQNSWSPSWGKAGKCVIPESRFGQAIGGFWAVRAVVQTGSDFPVTPKLGKVARDPFREYALAH